jgi:hypothetical protein
MVIEARYTGLLVSVSAAAIATVTAVTSRISQACLLRTAKYWLSGDVLAREEGIEGSMCLSWTRGLLFPL